MATKTKADAGIVKATDAPRTGALPRLLNKHSLRALLAPESSVRAFEKALTRMENFPAAVRLGARNRRWSEAEVAEWLAARPRGCSAPVAASLAKASAAREAKAR